jgi:hypothetical protein
MNIAPGPIETVALALGVGLPLLVWSAQFASLRSAGIRFRIAGLADATILIVLCLLLPGPRDLDDVLGGVLLLATALLFWWVIWSLLAWGFTLTLLTALAEGGRPLTMNQWLTAYMQGGDLSTFARNRLQLLFGTGVAKRDGDHIVATRFGIVAARCVRIMRFVFGVP